MRHSTEPTTCFDRTHAGDIARVRTTALATALLWMLVLLPAGAMAQANGAGGAGDKPVTMEFPAEGIELRVLADIVSRRLKFPIIYDDTIQNKKVIIRVPADLPESALMGVLQSALRMKQMALVDAEQPGWKQIVSAGNLAAIARPDAAGGAATPIIQVINLKQADAGRVSELARPFLTTPGGTIHTTAGQKSLVVTDYAPVVQKVEQLIKLLDEGPAVEVKFVALKNADPATASQMVQQILGIREGGAGGVTISADERSGQLVIVAPRERLVEIEKVIAGVDRPLELDTKVYRLKNIAPERVDRLVKGLVGANAKRGYQSSVDRDSQSLVVSATAEIHRKLETLVKELDAPMSESQNPVRFYKLKNTRASDVLATLSSLMGEGANVVRPTGDDSGGGRSLVPAPSAPGENRLSPERAGMTPLRPGSGGGSGEVVVAPGSPLNPMNRARLDEPGTARGGSGTAGGYAGGRGRDREPGSGGEGEDEASGNGRPRGPTVTADVNTNSIIVIAPAATQEMYAGLIGKLDQRRPQVQVECTIVTLDTSDNFSLGVDFGKQGGFGDDNKIISFGSFGVATVNPTTGGLTPVAATGGTLALLAPGIADIVVRTLSTNSRARLVSAPQLLVNDNGRGKLQSVNQEPFAEILDTNTTQSRTGLGGLAQAGTTITVEPHISEDDYLQLAYSIELSSFTGQSRQGLPPPSQKNSVDSTVTIPDGHTIVVGGLQLKNLRESKDSLPFLDKIPILNLIGSQTKGSQDLTLFVFIKPVILRDDRFRDLKLLSDRARREVGIPGSYPESKPIPMR